MPSVNQLLFLLTVHMAVYLITCDRCCEINYRGLPQYDLMKTNSRSNQPIISRRAVSSVNECEKFAASKKALAFNFVSAGSRAGRREGEKEGENTCQALQCPEDHNMTTLLPAANYKYYSMYPIFIPPANATLVCVAKVGMFLFSSESFNYTQARSFCHRWNASLAHVISEERTEGLGKFISQNVSSFVGLSSNGKERIWKNEFGEPLSCFDYRAWGEGEPSHSKGCVALVNPSAKSSPPFWKLIPCHTSLPFICEISPLSERSMMSRRRHRNRHHNA